MYDNTHYNQASDMNNEMNIQPKKKKGKTKYVIALLILAFGILLIVIGGALLPAYDFSDFEREDIINDFSEYNNSVKAISVDAGFSDVKVVKGDNLKVECKSAVKDFLDIDYKSDGTLKVDTVNKKPNGWFMTFSVAPLVNSRSGILFGEITITVPERTIEDIKVESAFGRCEIDDIDVTDIEIDNAFGQIKLNNVNCLRYAKLENTFGEISLENCTLGETKAENSFGEIKMNECSILGDSEFEVSFGDIKADLLGSAYDYEYDFDDAFGSSSINGKKPRDFNDYSAKYEMDFSVAFGDVKVNFGENTSDLLKGSLPNYNADKDGEITDANGNKIVP